MAVTLVSLLVLCDPLDEPLFAQPNVFAWGSNGYGQTNVPSDLTNATAAVGGVVHSAALRTDGTVVAWGDNTFGQTNVPADLADVLAIASGSYHTLALKSDGTVAAWGDNSSGQTTIPVGLSNVVAVAGNGKTSYAVIKDGSLVSWGAAAQIPVGLGNVVTLGSPTAANKGPTVVTVNGTTLGWGAAAAIYAPPATNFVSVASGYGPGLTVDGRVQVVSGFSYTDSGLSNIVAIDVGTSTGWLALGSDGTIYHGPANVTNVVAISSGDKHSLAVIGVGPPVFATRPMDMSINRGRMARFYAPATGAWPIIYQWQFNGLGIPGATRPMLGVTNVQDVGFGTYTVIASNGLGVAVSPPMTLRLLPVVGQDWSANVTNPATIATSTFGQGLTLERNGQVTGWGANDAGQSMIPLLLSNVVAISANCPVGYNLPDHCLALTASGEAWSWGRSSLTNKAPWLTNIATVSAGYYRDVALRRDGQVVTWSTTPSMPSAPSVVATNIVDVSAPKGTANGWMGVTADGLTAGSGPSSAVSNVVAVAGNGFYYLGLIADGSVTAWGSSSAETSVPGGLTNVIAIATSDANNHYALALRDDGTLVAWGNVPSVVSNMVANLKDVVAVDGGLALIGTGEPFLTTPLVGRYGVTGGQVFFRALATGQRPLHYQWRRNGAELAGQTRNVLSLANLSPQDAGAYSVVVTNLQGAITSAPAMLAIYDYARAIDLTSNITWTSFGNWIPETNITHDGISAAQSGGSPSTLRGTVTGPGTLSFWWKLSGPPGAEELRLYVNGAPVAFTALLLPTDWRQATVYLGAGVQVVDWIYQSYVGFNQGAGFVDDVSFTPGVTAPFFMGQPQSVSQAGGGDVGFVGNALGTPPLTYQWQFEGGDIPGATLGSLTLTNVQPADAGSYSLIVSNIGGSSASSNAVLTLGRIAQWGSAPTPPSVTNAVSLAAGLYHGLALQPDGRVLAWGNNSAGQSVVPAGLTNVAAVGAGAWFNMAIGAVDGSVTAWGDNSAGQCVVPSGLSNVLMVAGGFYHAVALKNDGSVVAWGANNYGQTNVPVDLTNAVQIASAGYHNVALRTDGTVSAWGQSLNGETNVPSGLNDVVSVRAGFNHCLAQTAEGTIVVWGMTNTSYNLLNPPVGLTNPVAIAAGGEYNLALTPDGKVSWWGLDRSGDASVPVGLAHVLSITAGGYVSLALVGDSLPSASVGVRNPMITQGAFQVAIPTERGRVYRLEYKDSLSDALWLHLQLVRGTGREEILADRQVQGASRFYRVRGW